ncbi:ferritin-like domain-containing protein [Nitrospirillum amazonense]|uniref:YciE/YciF ferroxidase family protein n=1 Tax=Nitrospirillum amazonense TaxID=28077 RepID=UPI002412448D|nr:ferritin-like domain-containing protein [Nitrospirillum amazonense]MDG3442684.1 ferritin-like domain-containing protein [Nitrospirillum amazonense]
MGMFTKDIETLHDLFVYQLKDIYYAERRIAKALPKMAARAADLELRHGFETHARETQEQIARLEQVFQMHGAVPEIAKCPSIDCIIDETDDVVGEVADKGVLDAALVAAAQSVEHYEIARYGTLVAWAQMLGRADSAELLRLSLDEEKATDEWLTMLAKTRLNRAAA